MTSAICLHGGCNQLAVTEGLCVGHFRALRARQEKQTAEKQQLRSELAPKLPHAEARTLALALQTAKTVQVGDTTLTLTTELREQLTVYISKLIQAGE